MECVDEQMEACMDDAWQLNNEPIFIFLDSGIAIKINAGGTSHENARSARTRSQETNSICLMSAISIHDACHVSIQHAPAAARSTRVRKKPCT